MIENVSESQFFQEIIQNIKDRVKFVGGRLMVCGYIKSSGIKKIKP